MTTPTFRVLLGCLTIVACNAVPAFSAGEDFYAGKKITLVVGSEPGGGYDANARAVAAYLGRFIPGQPTVVVQNMPGAGSVVATNFLYHVAPKDGTQIGLVQRGVLMAKVMNTPGVQFDPEKIIWLGNMSYEASVVVAWHTAPHQTAADLFAQELLVGGTGATADTEATPRLLNAIIGTKFRVISGYPGQSSVVLALERGELGGIAAWAWPNIKSRKPEYLHDGKIRPLLVSALESVADLPGVPLALDYAKTPEDRQVLALYFAQNSVARPLMAPPGVPEDRVRLLRTAVMAMAKDPMFLANAQKVGLDVDATSGDDVDKIVQLIAGTPAPVAQRLAAATSPRN